MNGEIILGGEKRGIRCDMNVLEAIQQKFGEVDAIMRERSISSAKFIVAEMMNEHNYSVSDPKRYTPDEVGMLMTPEEYVGAWTGCVKLFADSVTSKKK
jgi:hypothetical protein